MDTTTKPDMTELLEQAKQDVEMAKNRLLKTFEFVPEDKLRWSPSASARTALQIAGHCGVANQAFATILRGEEISMPASPEEASAQIRAGGSDIANREAAVQLIESSTAEIVAALENVTPDMMDTTPQSPFGPFPFAFWIQLPAHHMNSHAPQIDYLQTIWGDLEDHR